MPPKLTGIKSEKENIKNNPGYPIFVYNEKNEAQEVISDIGLYIKITRENPWQDVSKNMAQLTPDETSWNFYLIWGFRF